MSDRKLAVENDLIAGVVDYYDADVTCRTEYYPYGMVLRSASEGERYRYGFQGQEDDPELKGSGNSTNYKYRMHDTRIGRFFATDPLEAKYPHNSPYAFSENRVIDGVELEGLEYVTYMHIINTETAMEVQRIEVDYTGEYSLFNQHHYVDPNVFGKESRDRRYYSDSFGPEGRGVKHVYLDTEGKRIEKSRWDLHQPSYATMGGLGCHGFYQGSGCITYTGYGDYNFEYGPMDEADAIAYQHDLDYNTYADGRNFVEDVRTLWADEKMIKSATLLIESSGFMELKPETRNSAIQGRGYISVLAEYKRAKIKLMERLGLDINNVEHIDMVDYETVIGWDEYIEDLGLSDWARLIISASYPKPEPEGYYDRDWVPLEDQ